MKISQMRYFLEVCKHENITKAAKNLHISQPTITVAIKDIEDELGVNLFHRIKQRIQKTSEGEYLYDRLTEILDQYDELIDEMKDIGHSRNHIRIGVPPMMGSYLFPPILSGFMKEYPDINIELVEYGSKDLHKMLINGLIDITLMIGEHSRPEKILFTPINHSYYSLYVNENHPLAGKGPIPFNDLIDEKLILFKEGFYLNDVVLDRFSQLSAEPNIVIQTSQVQTVKNFISDEIGIGFLNTGCVLESDRICSVELVDPIKITIGLEWKRDRTLYSDEANFVKFVTKNFS